MKPALIGASIALFVTAAAAQTGTGATGAAATPAQRQGAPASAGSAFTGSSQSGNTNTSTAPVVRDANLPPGAGKVDHQTGGPNPSVPSR
jgi:hypothetical protein